MDKRTRFLNAMDGKPVDRVPVSFYTHSMSPDAKKDNAVSDQLNWFHNCNMDGLCIETDGYMEYPGTFHTVHDWKAIRPHSRKDHYIAGQIDRAKRIADQIGDGAVFYMIYTPFSTIKHTIGSETLVTEYYRKHPEIVKNAMKVIEEDNFLLMDLLRKETNIDGFFVSLQNADIGRFTPDEYREALTEWDNRLLGHANKLTNYVITHMCSWTGVPNQLELWRDYDYKTANWAVTIERDMNLKQGREYFKPGTTVMGGFCSTEEGILYRGTKEEIKAETKRQLRLAGQTGTILCGDCSMPVDTNPRNLRYVVEACEEFAEENR